MSHSILETSPIPLFLQVMRVQILKPMPLHVTPKSCSPLRLKLLAELLFFDSQLRAIGWQSSSLAASNSSVASFLNLLLLIFLLLVSPLLSSLTTVLLPLSREATDLVLAVKFELVLSDQIVPPLLGSIHAHCAANNPEHIGRAGNGDRHASIF